MNNKISCKPPATTTWLDILLLLFDTPTLKQQVFCTPVASIKFWTPQHHVLSCWKWPHCDFKMSCLSWIHTKFSCISHLPCCSLVCLTTHQAHLSRWHLPGLLLTYGRPECWAPLFPRSPSYPHASNNKTQTCAVPSRWVNTYSRIWWFIILASKQILSYSLHTNDRFLISSFNKSRILRIGGKMSIPPSGNQKHLKIGHKKTCQCTVSLSQKCLGRGLLFFYLSIYTNLPRWGSKKSKPRILPIQDLIQWHGHDLSKTMLSLSVKRNVGLP